MIKVLSIIRKIISIRWTFIKPEKKTFLIYNGVSANFLYKIILKEESEILYVRYERINLFILFLTFWKNGLKNLKINYKINYIKHVNPKFVINYIDNDPSFYQLKNIYPDPCYISIQAGMRTSKEYYTLFDNKPSNLKSFNVDHLFVFGNSIKEKIQKNFKFNIIVAGSVLNNCQPKNDNIKKNNSVLYISQFRMKEYKIQREVAKNEVAVFNILYNFCKTKDLELFILPKDVLEEHYRKDLVEGNWKYINKDNNSSHSFLDNHKMIVFLYSTLGYEALARGIKCACFPYGSLDDNWVKSNEILPVIPFGYPKNFMNTGPFWTNEMNKDLITKTLHNVYNFSEEEWIDIKQKIVPEIMHYDPGNSLIKNILKSNQK